MKRKSLKRSWILGVAWVGIVLALMGTMFEASRDEPDTALHDAPAPDSASPVPRRETHRDASRPGFLTGDARRPFIFVRDESGHPVPGAPIVLGTLAKPFPQRIWTGTTDAEGTITWERVEHVLMSVASDEGEDLVAALDMITRNPIAARFRASAPEEPIELLAPAAGHLTVKLDAQLASPGLVGLVRLALDIDWSDLGGRPSTDAHRIVSTFRAWTGSPWKAWSEPGVPLRTTFLVDGAHVTEKFTGAKAGEDLVRTFSPNWRLVTAQLDGVPGSANVQGRLKWRGPSGEGGPIPLHPTPRGRIAVALSPPASLGNQRIFLFEVHPRWNTENLLARGELSHDGIIHEGILDLGRIRLNQLPVLLEGLVVDESHKGIARARVMTLRRGLTGPPQGGELLTITDLTGRYIIRGQPFSLSQGIVVTKEGFVPEALTGFQERAAGLVTVLRRGGEIRGRLDSRGALPDAASVELRTGGGRLVAVERVKGGTFSFRGLESGIYDLRLVVGTHACALLEGIAVPAGGNAKDPRLNPVELASLTDVALEILTPEGTPLGNRSITVRSSVSTGDMIRCRTNAEGVAEVTVTNSDSDYWIRAEGFRRRRVKLERPRTRVTLSPLFRVEVVVANPERIPARPTLLYVDLADPASGRRTRRLIESRRTTISLPEPGTYHLQVLTGQMGFGKTPAPLQGFQERIVTLDAMDRVIDIELPL